MSKRCEEVTVRGSMSPFDSPLPVTGLEWYPQRGMPTVPVLPDNCTCHSCDQNAAILLPTRIGKCVLVASTVGAI